MKVDFTDSELNIMYKVCQKVDPTGLIAEIISIREKIEKYFVAQQAEVIEMPEKTVDAEHPE